MKLAHLGVLAALSLDAADFTGAGVTTIVERYEGRLPWKEFEDATHLFEYTDVFGKVWAPSIRPASLWNDELVLERTPVIVSTPYRLRLELTGASGDDDGDGIPNLLDPSHAFESATTISKSFDHSPYVVLARGTLTRDVGSSVLRVRYVEPSGHAYEFSMSFARVEGMEANSTDPQPFVLTWPETVLQTGEQTFVLKPDAGQTVADGATVRYGAWMARAWVQWRAYTPPMLTVEVLEANGVNGPWTVAETVQIRKPEGNRVYRLRIAEVEQ